jgi:hypothetical protein
VDFALGVFEPPAGCSFCFRGDEAKKKNKIRWSRGGY